MPIIYTYPTKANPVGSDLILISDSTDGNKTKQVKVSSLPSSGGGSVSSVGLSLSGIAAFAITGDNPITSSGTIVLGTTGGSAGQFLDYQGNWSTPAGGSNLVILNEGTDITSEATSINFVGSGVTATAATNAVTVTIPDAFVVEDVQYSVAVNKGDALYISGPAHGSGRPTVGIADATAQQPGNEKYPVVGLALADYSSGEGKMIVTGILDDFNTNNIVNPSIGQPVYVSNSGSIGDTLTGTKPIGTDVIQNVAIVNKTGANGSLQVSCIGRTNDLPNLEQGKIWLGDATGVPSALTIGNPSAVLTSNGTTASWQPASSSPVTSYSNGVDNRLVTSTGVNGINGESGLTYDGTTLTVADVNTDVKITGNGISFPGQTDEMNDYEEGTWTPSPYVPAGSAPTTSVASGTYIKVGDLVNCYFYLNITSTSSANVPMIISGLPFSASNTNGYRGMVSISRNDGTNFIQQQPTSGLVSGNQATLKRPNIQASNPSGTTVSITNTETISASWYATASLNYILEGTIIFKV